MNRNIVFVLLGGIAALGAAEFNTRQHQPDLVVHEWGTFTSLQGSDGVPLKWNPLESSQLPPFVYDWSQPGLGRRPTGMLALGPKGVLVTLQRMETPVVYFYTSKKTKIDLTVRFPNGAITEWYPQATDVGPCVYPASFVVNAVNSALYSCGVVPKVSSPVLEPPAEKESLIRWTDLKLLPQAEHPELPARLRANVGGSHYFAARETDSAFVEVSAPMKTTSSECEKFLFYRGVGNFAAPLQVTMPGQGTVTVSNLGVEPLSHIYILGIDGDRGDFVHVDRLSPGEQNSVPLPLERKSRPLAVVREEIQTAMARSLAQAGLFPREAAAMVKTWADSWFTEQGARVLYLLPSSWTDQTLPMTINPMPRKSVRVMVGRAELITPKTEERLARELEQEEQDPVTARSELTKTVAALGRFAQPAFDRALARADLKPADRDRLRGFFYEVRRKGQQ
jgi:hypothetical protein